MKSWAAPDNGLPFWVLFAIYFPAVTGFTQGSSMSGDLKDPAKSLPFGTLLAVGISILIYFGSALILAGSVPNTVLTSDYTAVKQVSLIPFLVDAGVISATISSAMASFLGAPRILQSLAADRIFPFLLPFAAGSGRSNNPRRAVLLTLGIASATIALGQLNIIAPVVSMFFLISYGLLNYATYYEARSESPSFRPRFRWYHRNVSLIGGLACLGTMMTIDVGAGAVAVTLLFGIYQYLKRTSGPARWADSSRSYHLQQVREHLLAAAAEPEHSRDWRPQILLFSDDAGRRRNLLQFASWIQGNSGFTTAVRILEGTGPKIMKRKESAEIELKQDIEEFGISAFPLVLTYPNLTEGVHGLVQSFGIGPIRANTILLNWFEQLPPGDSETRAKAYGRNLRTAFRLGRNIIILDTKQDAWDDLKSVSAADRRIDVWWWGDATSRLMLLLAFLVSRHEEWEDAKIRVLAACFSDETNQTVADLGAVLDDVRIEGEPEVVIRPSADAVEAFSKDASLVFLPFRFKGDQPLDPFDEKPEVILSRLNNVAIVLAAEDIQLDADPEEGTAGDIAAVLDSLTDARKRAEEAEKAAERASEIADKKLQEIKKAVTSQASSDDISKLESELQKAKQLAVDAKKKAAKTRAKAETAAKIAEEAGAELPKPAEE